MKKIYLLFLLLLPITTLATTYSETEIVSITTNKGEVLITCVKTHLDTNHITYSSSVSFPLKVQSERDVITTVFSNNRVYSHTSWVDTSGSFVIFSPSTSIADAILYNSNISNSININVYVYGTNKTVINTLQIEKHSHNATSCRELFDGRVYSF